MTWLVVENGDQQQDMCYDEIGVYAQNILSNTQRNWIRLRDSLQ